MRRFLDRVRDLHWGQTAITVGALSAVGVSLRQFRENVADGPQQRIAEYFAPIEAQTQAQLAILNAGGSIADVKALTAGMTQRAPFPGWARTEQEVLLISGLDFVITILVLLALAFLWVWFDGRKAHRLSRET